MGTVTSINEARARREYCIAFERGDHVELAGALVESLTCAGAAGATPAVHTDGHIWQYDEQEHIYRPLDPRILRRMVHQYAGVLVHSNKEPKPLKVSAGLANGVITVAQDQLYYEDFFTDAPPGLTFANGYVNVTSGEAKLSGHSPAHKARFSYPFDYDPNTTPTRFLEFLGQIFRDDADAEAKVRLLQEYVGTALIGQCTKYQRMLILLGCGSNGKSVFQQIAEAAMPSGSVCAIAPQAFGQDYRRAMLSGRLLNIVSELPQADILDSENFKSIIAGDPITARQIFKQPFTFRPIAGHLCSANRLPASADQSHGFWRRMLVLTFNRTFDESEQIPHLADDLIRDELPAIVSWFVAGALRVQVQAGYTIPESHHVALETWRRSAQPPLQAFVEQRCDRHPAGNNALMVPSRVMYAAYRQWCENNGHRAVAINRFGEQMRDIGFAPEHKMNGSYYPVGLRA